MKSCPFRRIRHRVADLSGIVMRLPDDVRRPVRRNIRIRNADRSDKSAAFRTADTGNAVFAGQRIGRSNQNRLLLHMICRVDGSTAIRADMPVGSIIP